MTKRKTRLKKPPPAAILDISKITAELTPEEQALIAKSQPPAGDKSAAEKSPPSGATAVLTAKPETRKRSGKR